MPRPRPTGPVAQRRQRALELEASGWSRAEIAAELGITEPHLAVDLQRARDYYIKMQTAPIEELRARELASLDKALKVVNEVLERQHLRVNDGKVVQHNIGTDEEPEWVDIYDDSPNLMAADRVVKISESRRKLLGQDAPSKVETTMGGTVEYVIKIDGSEMEQL